MRWVVKAMVVYDEGDQFSNSTTWVLITADEGLFQAGSFTGANRTRPPFPQASRRGPTTTATSSAF